MDIKRRLLAPILVVHSIIMFFLASFLLVTKWFPYGTITLRVREWLYRVF